MMAQIEAKLHNTKNIGTWNYKPRGRTTDNTLQRNLNSDSMFFVFKNKNAPFRLLHDFCRGERRNRHYRESRAGIISLVVHITAHISVISRFVPAASHSKRLSDPIGADRFYHDAWYEAEKRGCP